MAECCAVSEAGTLRGTTATVLEKVLALVAPAHQASTEQLASLYLRPHQLEDALCSLPGSRIQEVVVAGVLEQRILVLRMSPERWFLASLNGRPLGETAWPEAIAEGIALEKPEDSMSAASLTPQALWRLTRPRIKLLALCHPEVFPLPRFPLGISDLARAVRARFQGRVTLADMQFGLSISDLLSQVGEERPDIVGISATFGQHDLVEKLCRGLNDLDPSPLLVLGGSLSALNVTRLLDQYPSAIIATGPGETTIQDIVEFWHEDRNLSEVRGACTKSAGKILCTAVPGNGDSSDFLPELDLLEDTLQYRGVMQLESSRGCTHACSFCPRDHKGVWTGRDSEKLAGVLAAIGDTFAAFPRTARKIFLVDEEFIGYDRTGEGTARALEISKTLWTQRFRWETSSRVDQVYRHDKDVAWHSERMKLWGQLREHGLDRCLFGLESGVDSILRRFNKRTTARQNAMAIRLLSASGVPIRCTYITFDQLMDVQELVESYAFQGRDDLLLSPQLAMPAEELFEAIHDDGFASESAQRLPLHSCISYMLVSMECLLGSPYLKKVEDEGLALDELPAMGRRNARFKDPVIGLFSDCSQRWIDRNFSLDYLLKSLEKISSGPERTAIRRLRVLLKGYSYSLLGRFLGLVRLDANAFIDKATLLALMDALFAEQMEEIEQLVDEDLKIFEASTLTTLWDAMLTLSERHEWTLINA